MARRRAEAANGGRGWWWHGPALTDTIAKLVAPSVEVMVAVLVLLSR